MGHLGIFSLVILVDGVKHVHYYTHGRVASKALLQVFSFPKASLNPLKCLHARRPRARPWRSEVAILLVVVLFFLPALYILSCGPAVTLMSRGYLSEEVRPTLGGLSGHRVDIRSLKRDACPFFSTT